MKTQTLPIRGVNNDNTISKNVQKSHEKAPFCPAFSSGEGADEVFCKNGRHFGRSKVGRGDLCAFIQLTRSPGI
ncbi:MAG: hypothetical protein CK519_01365 [Opitutia bacterium]|nr:MAG: hypothetical protein CK519_01365 [Opitutae bacterium]